MPPPAAGSPGRSAGGRCGRKLWTDAWELSWPLTWSSLGMVRLGRRKQRAYSPTARPCLSAVKATTGQGRWNQFTADLCHCTGFTETGCKTAGGCWEPWTLQLSLPQAKKRSVSTLWKEETCLAPPHLPVSPVLQPFPKSCVKARGSGCSGASQDLTRACRSHPQCSHAPAAACPAHMHMAFPPLPAAAHGKFIFSCLVCGLWISPWMHGLSKEAQWKCVKSLRNYLQS